MKLKRMRKTILAGISILCLAGSLTSCRTKALEVPETSKQTVQDEQTGELAESKSADEEKIAGENVPKELSENKTSDSEETEEETQEETQEKDPEGETSAALRTGAAGWQSYQDQYLSYEIPKSWAKNNEQSSDGMMFAFFQSQDPKTQYPSNINVQITQTNTGEKQGGIDYSSKEIQEEFHQFLLSDMGLPAEAAKGTFSVTTTKKGVYVYSLGFERRAMDNTMVHQTIYLPMNMEHSIVIWATDFKDGATVSADEAALHLCETLEIIK